MENKTLDDFSDQLTEYYKAVKKREYCICTNAMSVNYGFAISAKKIHFKKDGGNEK